ncbi:serine--tRNA ligase [Zymomonas sp.]|uniref:serine--tRNA ligase n=1 Tax=Zymomonas sp. TaxID=2068624 RepID=UPI0025D5D483|nr:serine--tRNA ligase [Zymomonas sp.]MCA1956126.1 serine--tRNA ligase [Zymomonas sp.]
MHDIRLIRSEPENFDKALSRRGFEPVSKTILEMDGERRTLALELQTLQTKRNEVSRQIGQAMKQGEKDKAEEMKAEVSAIKEKMAALEGEEAALGDKLQRFLSTIPNLAAEDVPEGKDEQDNKEVFRWGEPRQFSFKPKEHADFAPALGLDFDTAAAMSGARFALMKGAMARLNRAIGQYMLDCQTEKNGFTEIAPPLLVRDHALFGTGQLPKFEEDLFHTTDDRWLIPTAEVCLTNIVRESILDEKTLPLRFTALTPCFRAEAGAAGRDTRGLIRQHQFDKVEMVAIATPEQSTAEQMRMVECAEQILQNLKLPYRRVLLCTGDMGFSATRTYDLEVWLPGQNCYREISSISDCGAFQARRMNTRYRPEEGKGTAAVHTLNGSGLAVGRTLVAILENYQEEDGTVTIPEVLHPYMNGITKLEII